MSVIFGKIGHLKWQYLFNSESEVTCGDPYLEFVLCI